MICSFITGLTLASGVYWVGTLTSQESLSRKESSKSLEPPTKQGTMNKYPTTSDHEMASIHIMANHNERDNNTNINNKNGEVADIVHNV